MKDLSKQKEEEINSLLDERNEHTNKINAIDGQIADIFINHSDAENWEEIHNFQKLISMSPDNPLIKRIMEEKSLVHSLDQKLAKK